jgi:M6 family metalloprotease-like protein
MPLPALGYAPKIVPVSGVIRVLVIAVTFSDTNYTMGVDRIKQVWFGTIPAYYREISFGKLTITGDVDGWYKLPYPQSHYGRNCRSINDADCSGSNQSWHIAQDAVLMAGKSINFNNYDYYVFIHSGKGQETSHLTNDIWSVTYLDANVKTSSKTISRFNIVPELEEPPYVPNGCWTLEFGHNLGIPDLYNIANGPDNGRPILGPWELMDKGSWNGDPPGSLPAHMTAWAKIQLGFINGSMLAVAYPAKTSTFTIDPTEIPSSNLHAVKIPLTGNPNPREYYLVEVRTKTGFDSALPTAGVLITYVNESLTIGPVRVIDGDPNVSGLEDAVWSVGRTFVDNTHNLAVKVVEKIGTSYQITVTGNSQRSIPESIR